jgi:hypothetical protein
MTKAIRVSPPVSKPFPPKTTSPVAAKPFDPALLHADFQNLEWWTRQTPRFAAYASWKIACRTWRGNVGDLPPGAAEGKDYAQKAAELIFSGARPLPAGVKTVPFVLMIIRSLIAHDFDRPENRHSHSYLTTASDDAASTSTTDEASVSDPAPGTEEIFAAQELLVEFMRPLPLEYKLYVEMLVSEMYPTAADRAKALGVSIQKIRLMDRVIRRLRPAWKGMPPPKKKIAASK